jgi:hypothetical protein
VREDGLQKLARDILRMGQLLGGDMALRGGELDGRA